MVSCDVQQCPTEVIITHNGGLTRGGVWSANVSRWHCLFLSAAHSQANPLTSLALAGGKSDRWLEPG